jgi:hypothetical protein
MSLNNSQMHGAALVATLAVAGGLFVVTFYAAQTVEVPHEPPLKELITIEASLARKSVKQKQPVKEAKTPEPPVKPEGVSRDENKKPVEPPKKDDKKPPPKKQDDKIDITKFKHPSDDDPQAGAQPTTDIGQFNGSEKGFAPLNAGDPYWGSLRADLEPSIPSISQVQDSSTACFHITPEGKIPEMKLEKGKDSDLNLAVERAARAVKDARNANPQAVPVGQLGVIRKWVCFRFKPGG